MLWITFVFEGKSNNQTAFWMRVRTNQALLKSCYSRMDGSLPLFVIQSD